MKFLKDGLTNENQNLSPYYRKYDLKRISELNFEGEDVEFVVELNQLSDNEIDWKSFNYPDEETKEKVFEIIYYRTVLNSMDEILTEINRKNSIDDKYDIKRLADKVLELVKGTKESKYFDIRLSDVMTFQNLGQTFRDELGSLMKMSSKNPKNQQEDAIRHAKKWLFADLSTFKTSLENYEVNNEYENKNDNQND